MKFIKDMLSGPPVWDIKTLKPLDPPKEYPVDYNYTPAAFEKIYTAMGKVEQMFHKVDSTVMKLEHCELPWPVNMAIGIVFFAGLLALLSLTL